MLKKGIASLLVVTMLINSGISTVLADEVTTIEVETERIEEEVQETECTETEIKEEILYESTEIQPVEEFVDVNVLENNTALTSDETNFTYTVSGSNATITKYNGTESILDIPDVIDGYTVVGIGNKVFYDNDNLVSVVIPDSVTDIGINVFGKCSNLSQVKLSDNLARIGEYAFTDCDSLTEIEIPSSLEDVYCQYESSFTPHGAFNGCSRLRNVRFQDGCTMIADSLFRGCDGLETIEIPDTITDIKKYAFAECANLNNIVIPDSVTTIGSYAFANCSSIENIVIPDSVTEINAYTFRECINLKNILIPDSVTIIGKGTFKNCTNLESIFIPDSVTDIGIEVFGYCTSLSEVKLSDGLTRMGENAFTDCDSLTEIEIPSSLEDVYCEYESSFTPHGAFNGCSRLKNVRFQDGCTMIADSLFRGCDGLETIEIPDTITDIKQYAFQSCTNLKNVVIPDSVAEIGIQAFGYCANLSQVILSDELVRIGENAFIDCDGLTEIEIPSSLEDVYCQYESSFTPDGAFNGCSQLKTVRFQNGCATVVDSLFRGCDGLETIEIPDTITDIKQYAFAECANLKSIVIPDSVTTIGNYAFASCSSIENIVIPDSVTEINTYAFSECICLKSIVIPNSVTTMGTYVFSGCTNLESVTIPNTRVNMMEGMFYNCKKLVIVNLPETLENIRAKAFYGCESLIEIILPSNVTRIEDSAFYGCTGLEKVVIPDKTNYLGTNVFYDCKKLTDVTLGSEITSIPSKTFYNCSSLESIVLPYKVTTIGDSAFVNCTSFKEITIPRATTNIASNAFSYPKKTTIYGVSGTYAEEYANSKGITFVAQDVPTEEVSLDIIEKTVNKGVDFQLTVSIAPQNFTDEVIWTSSNESVATVSSTGYVETLAVGTTDITVTVGDLEATCQVTVNQPVTRVYLNYSRVTMDAGTTYQLTATVSPSDATNKEVEFTTSDAAIAEVSETGLITAKAVGTATLTATAKDGSGKYATCTITVKAAPIVNVTGVSLDKTSAMLTREGASVQLIVTVAPSNAANKKVTWSSSDTSVATVDNSGLVTAVANGTTTITVKTEDGNKTASCNVTVNIRVSSEQIAQVRAFVERMYTIVLGRAADPRGLEDWTTGLIEQRVDGAEVVNGFVNSAEFEARGLSDEQYIETLYLAILNREADEAGKADWLRAFALGQTRQDLLNGFVGSVEFDTLCDSYGILAIMTQEDMVRNFASRMYTVALNREADEAGLDYWVQKLMSGSADGAAIADGFINSPEFIARNLSDEEYIRTLYLTFLNREADEAGLSDWLRAFVLGQTRQQMLDGFIASAEFGALCESYGISAILTQRDLVTNFVKRMYTVALNREYDENGLNDWVNGLINGVIYGAQVADGFIGSPEFAARGLSNEDYIKTLYQTFFNRSASDGEVSSWVNAMTAYGQSRRDVLKGFVNSGEFGTLCENYGIVCGTLE